MSRGTLGSSTITLLLLCACLAHATPYPNIQVNSQSNYPEETAMAVNPTNPSNGIGVAQVPYTQACRYYNTYNGGTSWVEGGLPGSYELGDPSIVFNAEGTAYYGYIGTFSHSGIFINRTTDGGVSWLPDAVAVIQHNSGSPFEDKPYPCADRSSDPFHGNLYVSWTQFDHYGSGNPADSSRILFSRSTDGGADFSTPLKISDRGGDAVDSDNTVEGAVPAVGPNGTVYVAWAGPLGLVFDRSTDGGLNFGRDQVISDIPGGWDFGVPGIYRCNGLPTTKVDISPGPYSGRVYVCWSDQRNGDTDVFLLYSDDGGAHWSPRVRVNDDPVGNGKEQFFPWIDVDPVSGIVYVVFYDRREESGVQTDVYLAVSSDGGATFNNEKISASPFSPTSQVFFGDYIGIGAYDGWVRPLWVRLDGTTLSLWTALINPAISAICSDPSRISPLLIRPNPVRGAAEIDGCSALARHANVVIHDLLGRVVWRSQPADDTGGSGPIVWNGRDLKGRAIESGVYFLSQESGPATRFVVVR